MKKPEDNMDKVVKTPKVKVPKYKLISYTVKATIPTGMYANIQPEITVEAVSLEVAERAVMPHIEALFAKYREGDRPQLKKEDVKPGVVLVIPPTLPPQHTPETMQPVVKTGDVTPETVATTEPAIVLTVPFTRAKTAIESCTSIEGLALIEDQVGKSVKLIDSEKQILATEILKKRKTFNG